MTKRRRILGFVITSFHVEQDIIGTWSSPIGRVWQFGHVRFLIRRTT